MVGNFGMVRLVGGCGQGQEGLAGDAQVLALRVELAELHGEFLDANADPGRQVRQFALTPLHVLQDGLDLWVLAHTSLQGGAWRR